MSRNHLLLGISAVALATTAAQAQTSTNTRSITCAPGNACTIDNNVSGNDNNQAAIRVNSGTNNQASILQRGDRNRSGIEIDGNNNVVAHTQIGDDLFSLTDIDGDNNNSQIRQGDDENSATVLQTGNNNVSRASRSLTILSRVLEKRIRLALRRPVRTSVLWSSRGFLTTSSVALKLVITPRL
jgi:minor curlin subunit